MGKGRLTKRSCVLIGCIAVLCVLIVCCICWNRNRTARSGREEVEQSDGKEAGEAGSGKNKETEKGASEDPQDQKVELPDDVFEETHGDGNGSAGSGTGDNGSGSKGNGSAGNGGNTGDSSLNGSESSDRTIILPEVPIP